MLTRCIYMTNKETVCIKARSPPASLPFKGQVTEETTVKWSIVPAYLKFVTTGEDNYKECWLIYHTNLKYAKAMSLTSFSVSAKHTSN